MITIKFFKPFYTKIQGKKLRLVFAYQYLTVEKEEEVYHFIPIDGKEIIVNLETTEIENLSEVFVFQKGNKFLRIPLYQLLLVSNMHEHLAPIIKDNKENWTPSPSPSGVEIAFDEEVTALVEAIEQQNRQHLIDLALEERDEAMFYALTRQQN